MQEMTFPQAIAASNEIIERLEKDGAPPNFRNQLHELLSTENGARAFFVALLTGNFKLADQAPDYLIEALCSAPSIVNEILTKNLVMSTTMEHTHKTIGDQANAAGSRRVARRTTALMIAILKSQNSLAQSLQKEVTNMLAGISERLNGETVPDDHYASFLQRWGYDDTQLDLAKQAVAAVIQTQV